MCSASMRAAPRRCACWPTRGHVLAEARGGGANLQASGELEVEKVLHGLMNEAIGDRDIRPDAICLGIAGVDRPDDAAAVRAIMRRIGSTSRTLVVNDALIALVAGAGDEPGVVIVAGTGSIAYGRDASGRAARAGGWGYLLGDEGGGFWIGRAALAAVVRQFDGRGPATLLTDMVLTEMHLHSPTELIHAVYDHGIPPTLDRRHRIGRATRGRRRRRRRLGNPRSRGRRADLSGRVGHHTAEHARRRVPDRSLGRHLRRNSGAGAGCRRPAGGSRAAQSRDPRSTSSRRWAR